MYVCVHKKLSSVNVIISTAESYLRFCLYQFADILFRIFAPIVIDEVGLPFHCAVHTGCVASHYRALCG